MGSPPVADPPPPPAPARPPRVVGSLHLLYDEFYRAPFVLHAARLYFLGMLALSTLRDAERAPPEMRRHGVDATWIRKVRTPWGRKMGVMEAIEGVSKLRAERAGPEWTPDTAMSFAEQLHAWFRRGFDGEKPFSIYVKRLFEASGSAKVEEEAIAEERPAALRARSPSRDVESDVDS